jgi:Ring finger domain
MAVPVDNKSLKLVGRFSSFWLSSVTLLIHDQLTKRIDQQQTLHHQIRIFASSMLLCDFLRLASSCPTQKKNKISTRGEMETPERLENCPPTPEEVLEGSSGYLEEARVSKLKLSENNTCVICYSSVKEEKKCFPENCLHIFCFECLCKWSRQKNQCPLCKKGKRFSSVSHDFSSPVDDTPSENFFAHLEKPIWNPI